MEKILLTEREKAQQQKYGNICSTYLQLRKANPSAKRNRIMTAIARDYGMTTMGIRRILVACNAY